MSETKFEQSVINYGKIYCGRFNCDVKNCGLIYGGSYSANSTVSNTSNPILMVYASIYGGTFNGYVNGDGSLVYGGEFYGTTNYIYTVKFYADGKLIETQWRRNTLATKPSDPTSDGEKFGGWYEYNESSAFDFENYIENDITLYASWKEQAIMELLPVGASSLTYNGSAQKLLSVAGSSTSGTIMYQLTNAGNSYDSSNWTSDITNICATNAAEYTVWYYIKGDGDHSDSEVQSLSVTIAMSEQSAPDITANNETISGKCDGKINGLTTKMEISTDNIHYIAVTAADINKNYGVGTYYVRYAKTDNYNSSKSTKLDISNGNKLEVSLPITQEGYTVTASKTKFDWHENITITFALKSGYSRLNTYALKINGETVLLDANGKYTVINAESDITITVIGVADITKPTVEIAIGENKWAQVFNSITFSLFFKNTQEVSITAEDANGGSGIDKIYYYLSKLELSESELKQLSHSAWNEYKEPFNLNPQDEYIVYAKATDKAGNCAYAGSAGIVIDNILPVIDDIENNKVYCLAQTFTISDKYGVKVMVNDKAQEIKDGKFTLYPSKEKQKIVVTDKAGNRTEITVIINDGHTYQWQSEKSQYWQKCTVCGHETNKKDIPEITIDGADRVCATQDYAFSFTLPDSVTGRCEYSFENGSSNALELTNNDGIYYGTVLATNYPEGKTSLKVFVVAKTEEGYEYSVEKTISILSNHIGGMPDSMHMAICEVCGQEYNTSIVLKHVDAKEPTTEIAGNIEYWYNESSNKYFSDKDGIIEISFDDTVIPRLVDKNTKCQLLLWIILLMLGCCILIAVGYIKKRKRSVK